MSRQKLEDLLKDRPRPKLEASDFGAPMFAEDYPEMIMTELPELPPYDVGIHGQIRFAFSIEALRAYAEEAIKQERAACAAICEALKDRAQEEKAIAKFRAADGKSTSEALSRGQHWSAVSLYNSGLNNAAVAIRARSYAPTDTLEK